MANPNPYRAREERSAKKQRSLAPVLDLLERALQKADELLDSEDALLRLKAVHAVSQLSASYARVYEGAELEARLSLLESTRAPQTSGAVPSASLPS